MLPWQFWDLTPAEFEAAAIGYRAREERQMERLAWQTAYLLQPNMKKGKTITPDKLLGRKPKGALRGSDH